ncbi:SMC-Scp complex subunit ScpB [Micromonospora sp. MA102]|uniref:SMC-Scp complex subunit ScpB n=1 Tax=Micromonospora sp. MA102 TaxID=2952755 RepID=UPI0021C63CAE|nr:SMC-Scp complex subunit ScpB [Micromonospora sp. MA102]
MSDEERRDSLADQAAAWVPPWERPTAPKPTTSDTPAEPEPSAAPPVGAEPETLDTYRSPRAETVQDPTGESAGEPEAAFDAGEPAGAGTGADEAVGPDAASGDPEGEGGGSGVPGKRGRRRPAPEPEPAPVLDDAELRGALEAILLVVDQPVSELTLAQVLEQSPERIGPMLDEIAAGYTSAGHGFELRRAAGGWRLYTRPEYATYVERFVLEGQTVRLTQAALETLAVIAYKQPVTRSRISAIRGVNCDGVIRTLVSRGLVEECGTEADSGAFLYRTTTMFLEKLGLNSVDDLPPLAPFLPDDVEELADATR